VLLKSNSYEVVSVREPAVVDEPQQQPNDRGSRHDERSDCGAAIVAWLGQLNSNLRLPQREHPSQHVNLFLVDEPLRCRPHTTTMIAPEDHHAQHVNHEHLSKMEENDEEEDEDDGLDMENEDVAHAVLVAAADMAENASAEALAAAVADVTGRVGGEVGGVVNGPPLKRRRTGGKRGSRPWNDMLFELLKYRFLHGNVMVPFKSGGDLGKWVAVQRAQYMSLQKSIQAKQENNEEESKKWASAASEGGTERLTEERMKVLSSIGFVWDVVRTYCSVSILLLLRAKLDKPSDHERLPLVAGPSR
jgi:Helicase associated domain